MGIDSSADKPNSLNHLPVEAGAEKGSQSGSQRSCSVANTLCLHQRQLRTGSDQARPLRCLSIRSVHPLRLRRRFEALLQRLLLVDGRDILTAL